MAVGENADAGTAAEEARRVVAANAYMTLATADADGRPWATPVWFAALDCADFVWVSRPGARHSANIAGRSAVGIVVFDSTVAVGGAAAVYVEAEAEEVGPDDRAAALAVLNGRRRSRASGRGASATSPGRRSSGSTGRGRRGSTSSTSTTGGSRWAGSPSGRLHRLSPGPALTRPTDRNRPDPPGVTNGPVSAASPIRNPPPRRQFW
jgi:hypothetical protein